jgi:hypothetical protein
MKTIRSLMTKVGFSMVVLALGATGAWAQQAPSLSATSFAGTFTLPIDAQWGSMTLPAGEYSLYYGRAGAGEFHMVEVVGKTNASPHGVILAQQPESASATKNSIVCARDGDALIVRALEMPAIGTSVNFRLPHGAKLVAHNGKRGGYTQLAEAPMLIQRIAVTLNAK